MYLDVYVGYIKESPKVSNGALKRRMLGCDQYIKENSCGLYGILCDLIKLLELLFC